MLQKMQVDKKLSNKYLFLNQMGSKAEFLNSFSSAGSLWITALLMDKEWLFFKNRTVSKSFQSLLIYELSILCQRRNILELLATPALDYRLSHHLGPWPSLEPGCHLVPLVAVKEKQWTTTAETLVLWQVLALKLNQW